MDGTSTLYPLPRARGRSNHGVGGGREGRRKKEGSPGLSLTRGQRGIRFLRGVELMSSVVERVDGEREGRETRQEVRREREEEG